MYTGTKWYYHKGCEPSYLWLGVIFIPSKVPNSKYHIAPTAFKEVAPEKRRKSNGMKKFLSLHPHTRREHSCNSKMPSIWAIGPITVNQVAMVKKQGSVRGDTYNRSKSRSGIAEPT